MRVLKGLAIREFMSTYEEWHAFVIGFCEVLCPWPPRCHCERSEAISSEYHYYQFGRALGVIAWLIILPITIGIIGKIIQEVFF